MQICARQFAAAAAAATQLHDFVCWQFRCTGALLWSSSNFVERTPELLCLSCTDNWRSSRSSSSSSSSLQSHVNCVFFFFFLSAHFFSAFNIILLIAIICGSQDTHTDKQLRIDQEVTLGAVHSVHTSEHSSWNQSPDCKHRSSKREREKKYDCCH